MKFSGTAQYLYQDKILHHGTLLYNTDMSKLAKYLHVDKAKIQAKGIDSIKNALLISLIIYKKKISYLIY